MTKFVLAQLTDLSIQVIKEKHRTKETGRQPARRDLLDIAMDMADDQTGARMDDDQLRALVFTFLFAGHETTGVGMSWTLYELAKYPKIQEKIRKEANEVLGDGTYPLLVDSWLKATQTCSQMTFILRMIKQCTMV